MEFKKHLEKYLSSEEIEKLVNSFNFKDEHSLLLNTKKMSAEKFKEYFPNIEQHPFVDNGFYYNKDEYDLGKNFFHEMGVYYLQEPSAMIVSSLLNPLPGDIVLDMCAAPGGKAVQAALRMENQGVIIANDLSKSRTGILLNNIERMGISNTIITNNDFTNISHQYTNYFDKIILDAPCSGSGMFRKDERMLEDWSYQKVIKNAEIQKQLIIHAFDMLKQGGVLIYSTCSYSYEEDEEVVQYLLENKDEATLLDIPDNPSFYKSKANIGIHLFPFLFRGEGHYICLISKGQVAAKTPQKVYKKSINAIKNGYLQQFGDTLFAIPVEVKTKGMNIIRFGVKISTIKGKDEIYSYHLSHCIENCTRALDLLDSSACADTKGEQISLNANAENGIIFLTYKNIPFATSKIVNGSLKNHYPIYLRNKKFIFS